MKKLLICFLLLPFLCISQTNKVYDIGILIDKNQPELSQLLEELKKEVKAVVGEDAEVRFPREFLLANELNMERAEINYNQLLTSDIDIILAFGPINNVVIAKQEEYPKPTILFGAVNEDFLSIETTNETSGIPNFTYLIVNRSYNKDLVTFKELTGFQKVGIVIQRPFLDIFPYTSFFDNEIQKLKAAYKLIPFDNVADITSNLQDVDAVYLAETFYLNNSDIDILAKEFLRLGLPSFTSNTLDDVNMGILATNQSNENINQFFRRIALTIEAYVGGEELADQPTYIRLDPKLTLNYNTAERIGLPIKFSLLTRTDFVGEFEKKLSDKKYNLFEVMTGVLERNLGLQTSQKEVDLSEKDVQSAWTNYLPNVTASASATYIDPDLAEISQGLNPEYSTDGNITLRQTLFSPEANTNINTRKDLLGSQREQYNSEQLDAIFDASNAYFNALILKTNLQIRVQNKNLTKRNLQIAEENFEAGQSGKTDVLRFRSELAQDLQLMIEAANTLEQGYFVLNQLLNNPVDYNIDVDEVELEKGLFENYSYTQIRNLIDDPNLRKPFVNFLIEEAKRNAPELKSLDFDISAIGRSIRLNSAGRFLPTLALQGQYNQNFNQWGAGVNPNIVVNNYNVGLNLSIPLVDQNRKNINRQIAIIQKEQLDLAKSNTNLSIETNVNNAILALINEVSNIALSEVSEEAAEEALDLTQSAYSNGAVTIVQLIDAQNNYLASRLARSNAVYNYLLASLRLERFLGYYFLMHTEAENQDFITRFNTFMEQPENRQ
ncbi:TolC family protein [Flavobacteriaceae bacterium D16]|nr:TolC family protein [Flavobacteriaceae bacterium D16]